MDWYVIRKERLEEIEKDRQRLLSLNDAEASKLSTSDRYQRMRYQGEIEAAAWLADIRRKLPLAPTQPTGVYKKYNKTTKKYYKQE